MTRNLSFPAALLGLLLLAGPASAQTFTLQVGAAPPPPTPLVLHGDAWRYRFGTNAPQADWKTAPDAGLDATWQTGPGGFGYEDGDDATLITVMSNRFRTVYIRREFTIAEPIDPARRLLLTNDYDDAFVAWIDGVEVDRSPNAPGTVGTEPPFNPANLAANHEASAGSGGQPPRVTDLGSAAALLAPGTHVLSLMGINGTLASSDLSLITDLALASASPIRDGAYYALVTGLNSVQVSGVNTVAGSTRVVVNGVEASFQPGTGAWSIEQPLVPGANSLLIQAFNAAGAQVYVTNKLVILEASSTRFGGALAASTTWSPALGIVHLTNTVTIASGATLDIAPGTVVLLGVGVSLRAAAGGALHASGTAAAPITFLHEDGNTVWGELAAEGAGASLTLRHVETIGGAVKLRTGATGLMEDCYIHDYKSGTTPIAGCTGGQSFTVRRCHFRIYHETLWQTTLMNVEDCLFELANNASSDALDFDGAPPGSVIRRTTFRHGPQSNTDAIDIGPSGSTGSTNTLITDCLMYDFPNDKGVSIGEGSYGIVVTNCLIHGNDNGVEVKDSPGSGPACTANIIHCTIVNCLSYGFHCYDKSNPTTGTEGGRITNSYNNILWNNATSLGIFNDGLVVADHSLIAGGWTGEGNIDTDPLFLNPVAKDFRLTPASPAIGAGRSGATLGATFPVGSIMAPSHPTISSIASSNDTAVIGFWVDSERDYTLQCSDTASGGVWTKVADVYRQPRPRYTEVTNSLATGNRFYRLVSPVQP